MERENQEQENSNPVEDAFDEAFDGNQSEGHHDDAKDGSQPRDELDN